MVPKSPYDHLVARAQQLFELEFAYERCEGRYRIYNLRSNHDVATAPTLDEAQHRLKELFLTFAAGYICAADDADAVETISRKFRGT